MIALKDFGRCQPILQSAESAQSRAHGDNLESIRLIEHLLDGLELGNYCFEEVASLLILHQMKLVNDEKLDIEIQLFLY